jgi:two-component system heavy metal sensor histidine kinase CusS
MKHYSLRWKLVTWAALFALSASIICLWTTWILVRAQEVQALDRRLVTDARELFRDIENFQGINKRRDVTERFVPLALRDRLVEVRGPDRKILYMSPNLNEPVLEDGIETFHTRQIGERSVRIGVFRDQELALHVGADLKDIEQLGWEIARSLVIVIPVVLLLIAAGSWWLGSIALTPIENIRRAAERITAERLDERILSDGPADEIGRLINVLNATFERLQGSFEQAARFSADASHQLKTPIAVLRAGIEEVLSHPRLADEQRALRATDFDLRKLLEGSLEDARILGAGSHLQIETNVPETLPMNGDREMISLTVQNLVENAVKYNRPSGKILVSAEEHDRVVQICVGNNGPGIPPERTPHVFERFYRARGSEQTPGHGLGLSIARELARAHGGDLTLVKSQPDWTEFCLRLSTSSIHHETEKPSPATQQ